MSGRFQPKLLVGQKRNRLTIIGVRHIVKTFRTGLVRRVREVRARCECGREKWIRSEHVTGDIVKSCGCLNYEPRCADPKERAARHVLAYTRASAKARGFTHDLTIADVLAHVFNLCFYCGDAPTRSIGGPRPYAGRNPNCHGLDRLDSAGGYTRDNVVPCCFKCNTMKWDLAVEDFLTHVEKLASRIAGIRKRIGGRMP